MTAPVTGVTSSRRTVRVAIALATGQAALCGVIGFVTFGPPADHPAGKPLDPVAAPPPVLPAPSVGTLPAPLPIPPSSPAEKPPRAGRAAPAEGSRAKRRTRTPVTTAPRTTSPATTEPAPVTSDLPVTDKPKAGIPNVPGLPELVPPSDPVEVDGECPEEDARDHTGDGLAVVCRLADDGTLRWRPA